MTENTLDITEFDHQPQKNRKVVYWVLGLFLAFVVVVGGLLWAGYAKLMGFERIDDPFPDDSLRPAENPIAEGETDPSVNILLLGSDSRADTDTPILNDLGNRADTIMVAHIPSDRSGVQLMSIMRDSWVEIPGHGNAKINAAMAYGGVPLMIQTVEGLIDQRIDHVAVIDFNGFKNMTDALGGVEINNPQPFTISGKTYEAGPQNLNGEEALLFVRSRNFADGDYTRVENQQLFMKSMAAKVLSRDTLTSPGKMIDFVDATTPYIAMDNDFGVGRMVDLGTSMSSVRAGDITSFTMPTNGTGREGGGQSVVYVNWDALETVREKFDNDDLADYYPEVR